MPRRLIAYLHKTQLGMAKSGQYLMSTNVSIPTVQSIAAQESFERFAFATLGAVRLFTGEYSRRPIAAVATIDPLAQYRSFASWDRRAAL